MNKLPTYEDCLRIVENNKRFVHKVCEYNGYKIHIFNYLLAQYQDFKNPITGESLSAFELRGLTFVEDNGVFHRNLMLHKFFNINQCEGYMYDELKNLKITSVDDKRDGSLIRFIKLPSGEIIPKTIMGLNNLQTKMASDFLLKDRKFYNFVSKTLDNKLAALFEITSPQNRIVLNYKETEITLIQLREEETGKYLNVHSHQDVIDFNIKVVAELPVHNLDYYLNLSETTTNIEGWIVSAMDANNQLKMFKIKTKEYFDLHFIMTEIFSREDLILDVIYQEKVDDVLGRLPVNDSKREVLKSVVDSFYSHLNEKVDYFCDFIKLNYNGDKKAFGLAYSKHEFFSYIASFLSVSDEGERRERILLNYISFIKKKTYKRELAKKFLNETLNIKLYDSYFED